MRRLAPPILVVACLAALVSACFGRVLFRGEQFSFRDAGMYYYPLYHRVQAEWAAGRWPLWDDGENAGMPLLGNPTAAVLYPPKLILFAALPYPWAMRAYAVAHVLLGFAGMRVLLRGWKLGGTGATLAAFGYAFSGPMLSMTCNIIFLVGAGWIPWGLRAADHWVREGRRDGPPWLAAVLAMMVLGGDPQGAYVLGLCAGGYALGLGLPRGRQSIGLVVGGLAGLWSLAAVEAWRRDAVRRAIERLPGTPDLSTTPSLIAGAAWAGAVVALAALAWRNRGTATAGRLGGLAGAAVLGGMLAAAQLVPTLEFIGQSERGAGSEAPDAYAFSIEPAYLPGMIWPNAPGSIHHGSRAWMGTLLNLNGSALQWFSSLYPGGLVVVLGLAALGFRGGPPWRMWLSAIAVAGTLASLGQFAGPLWWLRMIPGVAGAIGPHDPADMPAFRPDGHLPDAWGSPYWALANAVPGFGRFRFPAKLFPIALAALAGLAGWQWDRLASGHARRAGRVTLALLALTLLTLAGVEAGRSRILATFAALANQPTPSGPLDAAGSLAEIRSGLIHGAIALGLASLLAVASRRRPGHGLIAAVAVLGLVADLAIANGPLVLSVPQSVFDRKPEVVRAIEEAERRDPAPGPFRVHRLPVWNPSSWARRADPDRLAEIVRWERDTLMPKYGLLWGLEEAESFGVSEVARYHWNFTPFRRELDARGASLLGVEPGRKVLILPRRGFDLWNTRYFITPTDPNGWADGSRAYASLLEATDQVAPPLHAFDGPDGDRLRAEYVARRDFQVLRNRNAFPRAWVVHDARFAEPLDRIEDAEAVGDLLGMLYQDDALWHVPGRAVEDLRRVARVEKADRASLERALSRVPTSPTEAPTIVRHEPGLVEIDVAMRSPGLVILADLFYPGWRLTVDGRDTPILRVNGLMRGAAVGVGRHRLVYTYRPASYLVGSAISAAGLLAFALLLIRARRAGPAPGG